MTTPLVARLLLADDHVVVRQGLRSILDRQADLQVVAEAGDGAEAVARGLDQDLDLAILDVSMPKLTGLQAARQLASHRPDLRVLMLSMHDNEQFVLEAVRAGAAGYVLKAAADTDLVEACRAVLRGGAFVHPHGAAELERLLQAGEDVSGPLTPRESEVTKLIAEGHSGREIAAILAIAEKTVERHRTNILEKLGLEDRVALTRYAIRRGLVEP
jgi:DNA-binding NarL/FixJ family response regulator